MSHLRYFFILVVISGFFVPKSDPFEITLVGAVSIIKIAGEVVGGIAKAWNIVDQNVDFSHLPLPLLDKTEEKLFGKINVISQKLDELAVNLEGVGTSTITVVLNNLPDRVRLELRLNDLLKYMTSTDVNFKSFLRYADRTKDFERLTLEDFARMVVSHDSNSVVSILERIHAFIVPSGIGISDTGILELLRKDIMDHGTVKRCQRYDHFTPYFP